MWDIFIISHWTGLHGRRGQILGYRPRWCACVGGVGTNIWASKRYIISRKGVRQDFPSIMLSTPAQTCCAFFSFLIYEKGTRNNMRVPWRWRASAAANGVCMSARDGQSCKPLIRRSCKGLQVVDRRDRGNILNPRYIRQDYRCFARGE